MKSYKDIVKILDKADVNDIQALVELKKSLEKLKEDLEKLSNLLK